MLCGPGSSDTTDGGRLRPRAVLDDLGAELVAHDDVAGQVHDAGVARPPRGRDELVGKPQRVQVGAADPAGQRANQHLAGARLGRRDVGDHELAVAHDGRPHGLHHVPSSASSAMSALRPR